jgi:PAT family beta-lactamase induction signal transducer AmpG
VADVESSAPTTPAFLSRTPWSWIPTLYFASGMPYLVVTDMAGDMFKLLGAPNAQITLYTGWLKFPYVIKLFWSPLVQGVATRRLWTIAMQVTIAAAIAAAAFSLQATEFLTYSLVALAVVAVSSATHDVAADGFYLLALSAHDQAWYVGIRNTCYRLAMITGKGVLVIAVGYLAKQFGMRTAWILTLGFVAALYFGLGTFHAFALPRPANDDVNDRDAGGLRRFVLPMITFFQKPRIVSMLAFLLLYRFAEAQLTAIAGPFLLDARDVGGMGLHAEEKGFIYGVVGTIALMAGGILGGMVAARDGLKSWLWKMALAIHLPNVAFLYLAYAQPTSLWLINLAIGVEQFGYGFGFTSYMLYCIYIARGQTETVHYAMCTGFMALGMMIPGMWSGWLQERLGYQHFFLWIMLCTIPSFAAVAFIPLDPQFGKKAEAAT